METQEIIDHANLLIEAARNIDDHGGARFRGIKARACDFLNNFAGRNNPFVSQIQELTGGNPVYHSNIVAEVITAFIAHLEAGLVGGVSPKRQAELDVVSDFLEQANMLLNTKNVHPAAPAVLIGATLEEFLRTWIEEAGLSIGTKKPGLDGYAKILREAEFITKQDIKDITSWSGIRNHAAHGEWGVLGDINRVKLMLDGVNLFMRRYMQ